MMYGVVLMAAMIYCWTVVTAQRYAAIVDTVRGNDLHVGDVWHMATVMTNS